MMEFKGNLTGNAEKCFRKQMAKWFVCRFVFFWIICFPVFFFQFRLILGDKFPLLVVFFGGIIFVLLFSWILCFKTNAISVKKITVADGRVTYFMDKTSQAFGIKKVKAVYEYDDFYFLKTGFLQFSIPLVCQKDQLVTGSIEEFEEVFKNKIVKKG